MGIRIAVGDGGEKPSSPPDRSGDASRRVEIRGGKGLDLSSPAKPASTPASKDPMKTTDAEKAEETCDTCSGPFRDAKGNPGSKRLLPGGAVARSCRSCTAAKSGAGRRASKPTGPIEIRTKE